MIGDDIRNSPFRRPAKTGLVGANTRGTESVSGNIRATAFIVIEETLWRPSFRLSVNPESHLPLSDFQ